MSKREYDGMRYPSVDELLEKVDSKYKLAVLAAKRAHIIDEEDWTAAEDGICVKPIGQALEEVLEDKCTMEFKDLKSI
ncbi:MAG: DNA-directed RNA polymerase subunit omega [Acholeplasmatales bacterium]|nr:DNA-directed RNA polymerase subunit omega [Acholeplasmatales bacterium]